MVPSGNLRIRSSQGPAFDCYLAMPATPKPVPAIVLASSVRGVDADLRGIADTFAAGGAIAAAPDLFWRTVPGPLERSDPRAAARAQPRLERIRTGEQDLADVLAMLRELALFNGAAVVMGFCYGGPYAVLGPKRLGYVAGISCHGSQMIDFVDDLEGIAQPLSVIWGDQDHLAPAPVREAYRSAAACRGNVEVHVLRDVRHGFMFRGTSAFNQQAHDFSMRRALDHLEMPCCGQGAPVTRCTIA